ncbi:Carboxypeptidase S1 A [Pleurostoma richardsiae]|uniref:Carboxypeptidase S1 A n=1 Tax=Pleurostoma richardsiae TaxID=41990 RepID=A0AA38RGV9_9PEZI|nr:Carboxypeptidase S1 A [Pleurostoma richardsiae]
MLAGRAAAHLALAVSLITGAAAASDQTFIPLPKDITVIQSQNYPESSISYKETAICETTPGVRGYSGFVTLPSIDKAYNASIFFWYFEARENARTAPTTIYIPGGPGESFLDGSSGFPCLVTDDSNGTILNPWSWNNDVNMLYLDVPVQTGYSFTNVQNGTFDLLTDTFTPALEGTNSVPTNLTSVAATLSSQSLADTANTTAQVARQLWQIAQVWFQEFPEFNTTNQEVNIWSYSYSGFFGPATVAYFLQQNEEIANGTLDDPHAKPIRLGTLGINNGCIDVLLQAASYPEFAFNNTYGVQAIPQDVYEAAKANLTKPDGCYDLINQCRALQSERDPLSMGNDPDVNAACVAATELCFFEIQGAYTALSTRSPFDIALELPGVFPPEVSSSFFNQRWVQEALGVPVNFTLSGTSITNNMFGLTGDPMIRGVGDLESLLSSGVNLALVYGDRDYRCNWLGVENLSLTMSYPSASAFRSTGYTSIQTNDSYIGGLVRQHGNVSFSRVFEAGHQVAAYQPETVYQIFKRAIFGRDIATGKVEIGAGGKYSSSGPSSSSDVKNVLPPSPDSVCYLYQAPLTCTEEQLEALANGSAVVKNYIVVWPAGISAGGNGTSANGSSTTNSTGAAGTSGCSREGPPVASWIFAVSVFLSVTSLHGLI